MLFTLTFFKNGKQCSSMNPNDNLSILIIDDEESILKMLLTELSIEKPSFKITTTNSPEKAIKWIKDDKKKFDLIICDLVMPQIDGMQVVHVISEQKMKSRVFLMSGYTSLLDQVKLFELGVEKILAKPINIDELIHTIQTPIIQTGYNLKDMVPVRISEVKKRKINPCDLYLILGNGKILKVFTSGLPVETERLERFLKNDVHHLYAKKEETLLIPSQFYVPIRITTLVKKKALPCEFYYKNKDNYKVLFKTATVIGDAHFDVLKKHKIKKLYIKDKDEAIYERYLEDHIDQILKSKTISTPQKSEIVYDMVERTLQNVFAHPNDENIKSMKKSQHVLQGFIDESPEALQDIISLSQEEQGIYAHSIGVATIAYALILEMGLLLKSQKDNKSLGEFSFESKEVRDIIFLGGLLHDIGKTFLNINNLAVFNQTPQTTNNVLETYKSHPQVGYERLKKIKGIPPKTLEIILQHEELCDGSGFPSGLTKMNISIYTQLITLANHFDHLHRQQQKKASECLLALKLESAKYNKQLLAVLEKMFTLSKKA